MKVYLVMSRNFLEVFYNNLELFGGSRNIEDYRYCGGGGILTHETHKNHNPYYKRLCEEIKTYEMLERLEYNTDRCLCGTPIQFKCYIQNKSSFYNELICVGSCCIKRFMKLDEKTKSRTRCIYCDKPYKSNKYVYCQDCKKQREKARSNFSKVLKAIISLEKTRILEQLETVKHVKFWKILFGKYKGEYFGELANEGTGYCKWLLENNQIRNKDVVKFLELSVRFNSLK